MTADAAHAGTQTDDGAGEKSSDLHGDKAPSAAPSSPDAANVVAVAEALGDVWATRTNDEDGSTSIYARTVDDLATVAVETLTPLIRAQIAAEIRAYAEQFSYVGPRQRDYIDAERAARIAESP